MQVVGPVNLPSTIPADASQMYSRNVSAFLRNLINEGQIAINTEDEIIRDTLVTYKGEVVNARVRELLGLPGGPGATAERSTA